jgi:dolichol-phosphate mannosyltransferase
MMPETPKPETVELTVILPAYNEAGTLRELLPEIKPAVAALTTNFEILVLDTQTATDNTEEICAQNGVTHVRRSGGNQYGDAIRTGIGAARGRYLLCMDADGSHSASYLPLMWAQRQNADIVIGSRYVAGGHTENPRILIWMSYAVNLVFRVAFNLHAKDVTNSFRLYRTTILKDMRLESDDFDILEEILIKAVTHRPAARVLEVPVTFGRRRGGESKRKLVQFAFGYLTTLRKLRKFQKAALIEREGR